MQSFNERLSIHHSCVLAANAACFVLDKALADEEVISDEVEEAMADLVVRMLALRSSLHLLLVGPAGTPSTALALPPDCQSVLPLEKVQ